MKRLLLTVGIVAACSVSVVAAQTSLHLSSPNDLMALRPGDVATIHVGLAGLEPGEGLVSLTGSVLFPSSLLAGPLSIGPGETIPNPGSFLSVGLPGQADGLFLTFSHDPDDHITQNGTFYSFSVQAHTVGSGVFTFDPLALIAEQYDPSNPLLPILRDVAAGPDLPFQVIPAPSALGLTFFGLAIIRRKRRAGPR